MTAVQKKRRMPITSSYLHDMLYAQSVNILRIAYIIVYLHLEKVRIDEFEAFF